MTAAPPSLLWFRDDLRLTDHPALIAAQAEEGPSLCVYILDNSGATRPLGGALKWFLHQTLTQFRKSLDEHDGECLVLEGDPADLIPRLMQQSGARKLFCHYRYQREAREQDDKVAAILNDAGCEMIRSHGTLLRSPGAVTTKTGTPYKIFTAWWKAFRELGAPATPKPAPKKIRFESWDASLKTQTKGSATLSPLDLDSALLPRKPDWASKMVQYWEFGEEAAQEIAHDFAKGPLSHYGVGRNDMAAEDSSRLSPYLRFGVLSPKQVWHICADKGAKSDREIYLSELGWRDFSWYTLFHNPHLPDRNLKSQFDKLDWQNSKKDLAAWQHGQTGIPVVDAGMRQLWETGWMHNRARMIVASFLAKHLLIDWRKGEIWFWDTLIDADPASNAVNWQWVAGTGIDASPFFRIFNPLRQADKFDPEGDYIRRWVPELSKLPDDAIAAPWDADPDTLKKAGVSLGKNYPLPIVSLEEGRNRAMAAYRKTRAS